jgi:hypothetical protein
LDVRGGRALVRYTSGIEAWERCALLDVVRHLGRLRLVA